MSVDGGLAVEDRVGGKYRAHRGRRGEMTSGHDDQLSTTRSELVRRAVRQWVSQLRDLSGRNNLLNCRALTGSVSRTSPRLERVPSPRRRGRGFQKRGATGSSCSGRSTVSAHGIGRRPPLA
jgi:hypothetical protein